MHQQKVIFLIILLTLSFSQYSHSHAINEPKPISRDSVQFEQKQRLESEFNQRHQLKNQQNLNLDNKIVNEKTNDVCFYIENTNILGATLLSPSIKSKLTSSYQSRCLSLSKIKSLANTITNYYIKQGYVTSQAFIPEQDLTKQKLIITVIEGKIRSIDIENSPPRLAKMIFPNYVGAILNLRDIEQGLEQLNRSSSAKYTIDIQPSHKNGYSRIFVYKKSAKVPLSGQLNIDNSGIRATGKQLITGSIIVDSLLGLGEQWAFSINTNRDITHSHYSRYYAASLYVPYGYWSYHYQLYQNKTRQPFYIANTSYPYEGKNTNQQLDISRLVYRDSKQRLTLQGSLKHKNVNTQLAQQTLEISSPTLSSINLSPQYSTILGNGYFTFNPIFEWGISILGASPDTIAKDSPRSHYRKASLSSSYQIYLNQNIFYLTSFYGQYTTDNLYSAERINIGGQYSVRGYQEQSLSGNCGFYWRNELNSKIANTSIGQWHLLAALDYGLIASDAYQIEPNALIGGATGVSFIGDSHFASRFLISKPLSYPSFLKPDNWAMYWSISFAI